MSNTGRGACGTAYKANFMFVIIGEMDADSIWGAYDIIGGNNDSRVLEGPDVL